MVNGHGQLKYQGWNRTKFETNAQLYSLGRGTWRRGRRWRGWWGDTWWHTWRNKVLYHRVHLRNPPTCQWACQAWHQICCSDPKALQHDHPQHQEALLSSLRLCFSTKFHCVSLSFQWLTWQDVAPCSHHIVGWHEPEAVKKTILGTRAYHWNTIIQRYKVHF